MARALAILPPNRGRLARHFGGGDPARSDRRAPVVEPWPCPRPEIALPARRPISVG